VVAGGALDVDAGGTQTGRIGILFALAANGSAVQAMGDDMLKLIAAESINQVKKSVTIDLSLREGARARI
jgi:type I restriction enzyme R subunit